MSKANQLLWKMACLEIDTISWKQYVHVNGHISHFDKKLVRFSYHYSPVNISWQNNNIKQGFLYLKMFSSTDNSIMYCYLLLWIVKKTTVYKSKPLYMNTSSFMTTIDTFQVSIRITYPDNWTLERKRLENRGSTVFLNQCSFTIWQYRSHPSIWTSYPWVINFTNLVEGFMDIITCLPYMCESRKNLCLFFKFGRA